MACAIGAASRQAATSDAIVDIHPDAEEDPPARGD
jgi:hypothetical protein